MDSSDRMISDHAELLLKKNDPRCINHFEALNTPSSKSKLALIYLEGRCKQKIDVDRALRYVIDNSNYLARAIKAHILVFEKGASDKMCSELFLDLCSIREDKTNLSMVNRVLSNMYLHGKGTVVDFQKAIEINPKLLEHNIFIKAMSGISTGALGELKNQIYASDNPSWIDLFLEYEASLGNKSTSDLKNNFSSHLLNYENSITNLINQRQYTDANNLAKDWFNFESSVNSAYYLLYTDRGRLPIDLYVRAADVLENGSNYVKHLRCLLASSPYYGDWDRYRRCLLRLPEDAAPFYRAQLEEHDGFIDSACDLYLKSIYKDPKTGKYSKNSYVAIAQAFLLKPELVQHHKDLGEVLCSSGKDREIFIVANGLTYSKEESDVERGILLLKGLLHTFSDAAERLYQITGDEGYLKVIDGTQKSFSVSKYFFKRDDPTNIIELNYSTLSPAWKIKALAELVDRYLLGKRDVSCDNVKASNYLLELIDLCEINHISSKFPKAKLGQMMYNKRIPCIDEKLMFEYLYPLRDSPPYNLSVSKCMLYGIGTDVDIKTALEILSSSSDIQAQSMLLDIYYEGKLVEKNYSKILTVLMNILEKYEPTDRILRILEEIPIDVEPEYENMSYAQCQNSKIYALIDGGKKAQNEGNNLEAIRYYDYARKCGSSSAAIREALIIIKSIKNYSLAYSILKTSNIDPSDEVYSRIFSEHQYLVDVDSEISKLLGNLTYR